MVVLVKKNLFYIGILFIAAGIIMLPMLTTDYKIGHDTTYHFANVITLTEKIKEEIIPSGIVGKIAKNFGYATNMFYPPLAHTATAYINVILRNPVTSMKLFHLFTLFFSGLTMFFLAKRLAQNNEIGFLSAIIYMVFPYRLSNIYIRDAQGESLLFIFLPLIILGLYELFSEKGDKNKFYPLFIIGYVGGMLSHLTLMVYFTVLIILFLVINYKKTLKNIKYFLIASFFILGITSFFYVPLLEHKLFGNYRVFKEGIMAEQFKKKE